MRRLFAAMLGLVLSSLAPFAGALDISVTLLGDPTPDGCGTNGCSLREAIQLANALGGADRILLPTGLIELSLAGAGDDANASGDLDIADDLEIVGAGSAATTVVQLVADRVFDVRSPNIVTLRDFRIEGGRGVDRGGAIQAAFNPTLKLDGMVLASNSASAKGGALYHEGTTGGFALPRLLLTDTVFTDNEVVDPVGTNAPGGARYMFASGGNAFYFGIQNCVFENNRAEGNGGAMLIEASNVQSDVNGAIEDTLFSSNVAQTESGGALTVGTNNGGIIRIRVADSSFQDNAAAVTGGAIEGGKITRIERSDFLGNTAAIGGALNVVVDRVEDSTFCDNHAILQGGAIRAIADLTIERSTFCDNLLTNTMTANDTVGGGAIRFDPPVTAALLIERSTFDANVARVGGALSITRGDLRLRGTTLVEPASPPAGSLGTLIRYGVVSSTPTWSLSNTLLIGTCSYTSTPLDPDVTANNIESGGDTCRLTSSFLPIANQVNVPAASVMLGPLADNGGPTQTRLPLAGSAMINAGSNSSCIVPDQRDLLIADGNCDVGAVELGGGPNDALFADGFD